MVQLTFLAFFTFVGLSALVFAAYRPAHSWLLRSGFKPLYLDNQPRVLGGRIALGLLGLTSLGLAWFLSPWF